MTGARTKDRFGFPIELAIDFRRKMLAHERLAQSLSPADLRGIDAARLLIDGQPARAADLLAGSSQHSFAHAYNLASAYTELGERRAADKWQSHARTVDAERYLRLDAARSSRRANVVIPFPLTSGGMRVQVDVARVLATLDLDVTVIVARGDGGAGQDLDQIGDVVQLAAPSDLAPTLRSRQASVTMVGCWVDYADAVRADCGAVVGYSGGEPTLNEDSLLDDSLLAFRQASHQLPVALLTCSRYVQEVYHNAFGRPSVYVPAALHPRSFGTRSPRDGGPFRVALMAWDGLPDKGVDHALKAISDLRAGGRDLQTVWITPRPPIAPVGPDCELHVNPPREQLFEILRSCQALLYTPVVDGLGLPPLEAMASGVPVVVTENGGSGEYAEPGDNCLVVPPADPDAAATAIALLHDHAELARDLAEAGRRTAERYQPTTVADQLAEFFRADRPSVCTELGTMREARP